MNKLIPSIKNGGLELVLSETFLFNTNELVEIDIPIANSTVIPFVRLKIEFKEVPDIQGRYDVTYEDGIFYYKLTNFFQNGIAMGNANPSGVFIAGYKYNIHFMVTAKFGHFSQLTVTMYKVGKHV